MPLNYRVLKKANFKHFLTEYSRQLCNPNVRLCPSVSIKSCLGMSDDFVLWCYSAHNPKHPPQRTGLGLFYKICIHYFYVDVPKWTSVKLDLDRKSPPQRRIIANIFGKEVDLHWRVVCSTNSLFNIRSQ